VIYVLPRWFPPTVCLPRHRVIVAVDIEQSTSRPDPVKAELRRALYDLFDQALRSAGIHRRHRDRFTDRGDGLLALIHPADQAPKPIVLNRAIPALCQLLANHNANLASAGRLHEQFRVRVVVHAGEIHYDNNGCFGEALDIAFRLLDAPGVKKTLRTAADPLALVISDDIYRTIVRHGYAGIDFHAFHPLITVHIAGHRYPGWIRTSRQITQPGVTEIASYKQKAQYQSRGHIALKKAGARSQVNGEPY
jgi:class 3 adenylate cyclase